MPHYEQGMPAELRKLARQALKSRGDVQESGTIFRRGLPLPGQFEGHKANELGQRWRGIHENNQALIKELATNASELQAMADWVQERIDTITTARAQCQNLHTELVNRRAVLHRETHDALSDGSSETAALLMMETQRVTARINVLDVDWHPLDLQWIDLAEQASRELAYA